MKSKRDKGKELEAYVADRLADILKDPSIKPTKASGASTQLADILCSKFIVECKQRTTKNITIDESVWEKLLGELPLGSVRTPLYILENKNKKRWLVMDLEDWFRMLEEQENG